MKISRNGFERYNYERKIIFNDVVGVEACGDRMVVDLKSCNLRIMLQPEETKQFLKAWANRITKSEIIFMDNGCIIN